MVATSISSSRLLHIGVRGGEHTSGPRRVFGQGAAISQHHRQPGMFRTCLCPSWDLCSLFPLCRVTSCQDQPVYQMPPARFSHQHLLYLIGLEPPQAPVGTWLQYPIPCPGSTTFSYPRGYSPRLHLRNTRTSPFP